MKPQIAVIGHGVWGANHARVLREMGALRWVHDEDESKLVDPKAYSLGTVLNDPEVTGIVIATPPRTHRHLTTLALQSGKHVLVEKPMATTVEDAQRMADLAKESRKILMVGHLMLYHDGFNAFTHDILDGSIGAIEYISSMRLQPGRIRQEENCLWSLAPHDVSMLIALAGSPSEVSCTGAVCKQTGIEDVVTVQLRWSSGVGGQVFVSWLYPRKLREVFVMGTKGGSVFDPIHPRLVIGEPLCEELSHFLDCIETGMEPLTDANDGIQVVKVLAACQSSMETGGTWISVR